MSADAKGSENRDSIYLYSCSSPLPPEADTSLCIAANVARRLRPTAPPRSRSPLSDMVDKNAIEIPSAPPKVWKVVHRISEL